MKTKTRPHDKIRDNKEVTAPVFISKTDIQEKELQTIWENAAKKNLSDRELKYFLDQVVRHYHSPEWLGSDPVEWVWRYPDPLDQEIVALVAALLAYGNVKQIRASLGNFFERVTATGMSPRDWARTTRLTQIKAILQGFKHRFNGADDFAILIAWVGKIQNEYGSLGVFFVKHCMQPGDHSIEGGLRHWCQSLKSWGESQAAAPSYSFLTSSPVHGSACKRWCMFLRWMGRKDSLLDPGTWVDIDPLRFSARQLVIPLDTHLAKISKRLKLTRRAVVNWNMAQEVTERLKRFDAADPIRYDFALCRLGILKKIK